MAPITRRQALGAAATASAAVLPGARVLGANDRIRLGVIGAGGRGNWLIQQAEKAGKDKIEWVTVADAWVTRARQTAAKIKAPDFVQDYRRVLDRSDIDGVIIATWDNTHSQIAIDACRAAKDMYLEKPMTSRPEQGPPLVKAVKESGRVVQIGVQQRSMPHFIEAKEKFFDSGRIGRVHMVRTFWNGNTGYLTKPPAGYDQKPGDLDWNACLGPLDKIAWDPKRYFNRFAYWDISSGGQTGGLLVHLIDVVHWYLGLDKPQSASAIGGIYQHDDGRDTPDNVNCLLRYPKVNVSFEATISDLIRRESVDIIFLGTNGRLHIFRGGYRFVPAGEVNAQATPHGGSNPYASDVVLQVPGADHPHMANWFDCMRSRKQPTANAADGHYAAMACHIANIAYQNNSSVVWRKEWDLS